MCIVFFFSRFNSCSLFYQLSIAWLTLLFVTVKGEHSAVTGALHSVSKRVKTLHEQTFSLLNLFPYFTVLDASTGLLILFCVCWSRDQNKRLRSCLRFLCAFLDVSPSICLRRCLHSNSYQHQISPLVDK